MDQIFSQKFVGKSLRIQCSNVSVFIDFPKAHSSIWKYKLYNKIKLYGIPNTLMKLIKATKEAWASHVKIGPWWLMVSRQEIAVKQGDKLASSLSNITLEYVTRHVSTSLINDILQISTTNRICRQRKYHGKNKKSYFWSIQRIETEIKSSTAQHQCQKNKGNGRSGRSSEILAINDHDKTNWLIHVSTTFIRVYRLHVSTC